MGHLVRAACRALGWLHCAEQSPGLAKPSGSSSAVWGTHSTALPPPNPALSPGHGAVPGCWVPAVPAGAPHAQLRSLTPWQRAQGQGTRAAPCRGAREGQDTRVPFLLATSGHCPTAELSLPWLGPPKSGSSASFPSSVLAQQKFLPSPHPLLPLMLFTFKC